MFSARLASKTGVIVIKKRATSVTAARKAREVRMTVGKIKTRERKSGNSTLILTTT